MIRFVRSPRFPALALISVISVFICVGCSGSRDFTLRYEEYDAGYDEINVELNISGVTVGKAEGDKITLEYYETDENELRISSENGVLTISRKTESGIKENFRFGLGLGKYYAVKLGIPENYGGGIRLSTGSGDITAEGLTLRGESGLVIASDTGKVRLYDTECYSVSAETKASDTVFEKLRSEKITVNTVTGDLYARDVSGGEAVFTGSSAKITLDGFESGVLGISMSVGDIKLRNCAVGGELTASVITGQIEGERVESGSLTAVTAAGDIYFKTLSAGSRIVLFSDTGDIMANILDPSDDFNMSVKSDYGKNNLKDTAVSGGSKQLEIKTVTGDISVKFAK